MVIPTAALVLPLYLEMSALGMLGTALSVILPLGFYPFGVYLAYLYFVANVPDDRKFTLQLGLSGLLESTGAIDGLSGFAALPIHQPEAALAALVTIAPIFVAFLFSQRFLVAGHLSGAQKG